MLYSGQTTKITFKVDVMGTSSEPKVRVILQTTPSLSFEAAKIGDEWVSEISIPDFVSTGSYNLKVEVLLNNKLFTPVNKIIEIQSSDVPNEIQEPEVQEIAEPADQEIEVQINTPFESAKPEIKAPKIKMPDLLKSFESVQPKSNPKVIKEILKAIKEMPKVLPKASPKEIAKPKVLEALSTMVSKDVKPLKAVKAPVSKSVLSKPIKINMADVDSRTTSKVKKLKEHGPEESHNSVKVPVKLIKEEVFYE
jgi:hypothetical protein